MKKLIFILIAISFILFGCANPTNTDDSIPSVPTVETPTEETPTTSEPNTPAPTPTNPPTETPENGGNDDGEDETTTTPENGEEETSTGTENPENENPESGNTENPENTTTEPTYERPILTFTDSISNCDLDYRFGFGVSNYANELHKVSIYFTVDGSDPSVNNGLEPGNRNTYRGQRGNNCNSFVNYVPYNADSVTIKAIAYYNDMINGQSIHVASEIVEKTFTINNYTITYVSDLAYSNLPSNRTMKKGQYTLGNIGRYYPDVRGYWFSHFEVNGVRYELNSSFTITENVTIKYCWTEWTYPWYDESDVPSEYTKITCEPYEYDDINYSNFLAYRVTYNNYIYTFMIEKSSIQKKRANGIDYTYASGTLKKNAVGNNGTLGRQLGSYGFSYGMESREPTKAKISGTSSSQKVYTTVYTNLNENDHNSVPTEIYVNLSDLRNINF